MKHTITLLMSIATLALSGCVTTKGFYVVDAYDAKGEKPQIIGDTNNRGQTTIYDSIQANI